MPRRKRNAGSSSDGTEDSDFSADHEHTDRIETYGRTRRNTRLTRASLRLSQSSQDSSPVQISPAEVVTFSARRVTRSRSLQQGPPVTPKKYPLRQSRSSGSDTEQHVEGRRRRQHGHFLSQFPPAPLSIPESWPPTALFMLYFHCIILSFRRGSDAQPVLF
ncbi:unnamed protein product [Oncorhynchus mykiss]|uniref:Uncharacterized protein n=1 Tax=Oncorhynchus mykiss TaxID=8022 RepID=A0A060X149_ONCMY|nr:unnamed protein product [Oncorhynchus mykiss]